MVTSQTERSSLQTEPSTSSEANANAGKNLKIKKIFKSVLRFCQTADLIRVVFHNQLDQWEGENKTNGVPTVEKRFLIVSLY